MKNKSVLLTTILIVSLFVVCAVGVAACNESTVVVSDDTQSQVSSEQVVGTITSISEGELLIDVATDSNEFLSGSVRVDVSEIDASVLAELKVDDTVVVEYPGIVGLSEPPLISATTLEKQS